MQLRLAEPAIAIAVALSANSTAAQTPDTTLATVSGIVHDSIARMPLAGAVVQLVPADSVASFVRTAISDSLGHFFLRDVPDGRYGGVFNSGE